MANAALITPKDPLTVLAFDAIHFRRGINYLPVRCMEFLIPIPKNDKGEADFTILQKAWWDVFEIIKEYHENGELSPMNLTLETRILSGSSIFLAPEYGNEFGTCSIEVLGTMLVSDASWASFKNKVAKIWAGYKDKDGQPLNVRPHWGKEFPEKVGDRNCIDFVRDGLKPGFKRFKEKIKKIADMHGFNVKDMRDRFSNKFLEDLFGTLWDEEI